MNEAPMDFTGERYVPELDWPEVSYEHWHRYLCAEGLVEGKTVLDVACGEGYGSHWIARRAESVVGVDISEEAIAHARVRYPGRNLSFLQGGADLLPIEGGELFDVVISFETIEHIDIPTQERFLLETKRVLKPNGLLLISTPNKYEYSDARNYSNEFHVKEFYENEFVEFLSRSFRHVALMGQMVYPASFVWPLRESRDSEIRQMHFGELGFYPLTHDARRALYFVAIASDEPIEATISSTLIDVSLQALTNREQELIDRTVAWKKELAARHLLEEANQGLTTRVAELTTYVDRCNELQTNLEQVTRERTTYVDRCNELLTNLEQVTRERTTYVDRCNELQTSLEQVNRERLYLRDAVAELQDRCNELETKADQISRDRSSLQDAIAEFQSSKTWALSRALQRVLPRKKANAA
jgi:ubiquinone/menaquinone biosynthesis C-methylase UbiE